MEVLDSHNDSKAIYLGERYGWNHNEQYDYGTNYVTTGGGMALSGRTLALLQECKSCSCSSPNAPDDMTLGSWCKSLSIPITHEEGFHQAEPHNYHEELLEHADPPVSFHRFNVRLPASTSETEQRTARQENWKKWKKKYFIRQ